MPFTISHVAAVLPGHRPLRRLGLFSAAIIGAMVPDLGFLLHLELPRTATHSAHALLTFCLPVGMTAFWLFQLLIKPAWCEVLPGNWRQRLRTEHPVARLSDWRNWVGGACAIVLGAFTHLVWDGFTHEDGRGVRMLPFLDDTFGPDVAGHPLRMFRVLQHVSSVVGLLIVIVAARRWARGAAAPAVAPVARRPWADLPALESRLWLSAYVLVPPLLMAARHGVWMDDLRRHNVGALVTSLAYLGLDGTFLSLTLVSALVRLRIALRGRRLDARAGLQ